MFDALRPPADLASARARLRSEADALALRSGEARAPGSVVHLGPGDLARPGGAIGPEVAVVVVDSLLWQAGDAEIARLVEAIGRDRPLLFLEPTLDAGWRAVVHRLGHRLWLRRTGHGYRRDVPAALRSTGLVVTNLNRFGLGPLAVRSYALGRAERVR